MAFEELSIYIVEDYPYPWQNKRVFNNKTKRWNKVGSLAPNEQERYKPKWLRGKDSTTKKSDLDEYDKKNKLLMDFYVSIPESYESVDDYVDSAPMIIATTSSTDVMSMFSKDNRVVKFKGVPIDAVKKFFTLKEDNSNLEDAEFKDFKQLDAVKKNEFIKYNTYRIFQIAPKEYMDNITVVDDTPDEQGFVDRRKDDDMGVLEALSLIIDSSKKQMLTARVDKLINRSKK